MREDCQRCCYCPREVTVLDICGNLVQNINIIGKKGGRKEGEGEKEREEGKERRKQKQLQSVLNDIPRIIIDLPGKYRHSIRYL